MISVLIPIYNYSIKSLVKEVHRQLIESKINFEILCLEDGSDSNYVTQNLSVRDFKNTSIIISKTNYGSIKARQFLSDQSKFDWLLFLDADVMPKSSKFILSYIKALSLNYEVIYGGFAYETKKPHIDFLLRWSYGQSKEEIPSSIRNKNPYKVTISANFMIKRSIFDKINSQITFTGYGLDNFFGALLKVNKIRVLHICNTVYHLGIEKSTSYLKKKERAAENLLTLYKSNKIKEHNNDLLTLFIKLERLKLHQLFALFYKLFQNVLRKNILGSNPSIMLLQLYRISYMCYKEKSKKNNSF